MQPSLHNPSRRRCNPARQGGPGGPVTVPWSAGSVAQNALMEVIPSVVPHLLASALAGRGLHGGEAREGDSDGIPRGRFPPPPCSGWQCSGRKLASRRGGDGFCTPSRAPAVSPGTSCLAGGSLQGATPPTCSHCASSRQKTCLYLIHAGDSLVQTFSKASDIPATTGSILVRDTVSQLHPRSTDHSASAHNPDESTSSSSPAAATANASCMHLLVHPAYRLNEAVGKLLADPRALGTPAVPPRCRAVGLMGSDTL